MSVKPWAYSWPKPSRGTRCWRRFLDRLGGDRMNSLVSIKSYGFEWYTEYGLSERQAAQRMREQGIDWAIIQNLSDPLPGSAVRQALPPPPYDDRRVRDALRAEGIRIFEATSVFFHPEL